MNRTTLASPSTHDSGDRQGASGPGTLIDGRAEKLLEEIGGLPDGDQRRERLRENLVRMHTPYVRNLVNRYGARFDLRDDLEQAAMMGLVKAINRFDPALGPRFLPYASLTVTGELKRYFRDQTWAVHVPRRIQELRLNMHAAREEFTTKHRRSPTVNEMAALLEVDTGELIEAMGADSAYTTSSLDTPISGDDDDSQRLADVIADPDERFEGVLDHEALQPLVAALPGRERRILQLRFWGNLTQAEIADRVGVSQMHVSRILTRTLADLRTEMLSQT